jgi:hypothetical protein
MLRFLADDPTFSLSTGFVRAMTFTNSFGMGRVLAFVALLLGAAWPQSAAAQPGVRVPVEAFYDELAPYGRWMQNPQYGQVWVPQVAADFQPYATDGRWVMTEYGNTWESDYPWGWAPFHYGRWLLDEYYGWIWVPGDEWAPAWVSWRSGGGYYGWAPLAPGFHVNIHVNLPWRYWTFVPQYYVTYRNPYRYCVPRTRVVNVYRSTTIINNYYRNDRRSFAYGPSRQEVERVTRQRVPVYRADDLGRRGGYARNDNRTGGTRSGGTRYDRSESPRTERNFPNQPDLTDSRGNRTNDRFDSPSRYNRPEGIDRPNETGINRPRRSGEVPGFGDRSGVERGPLPNDSRDPFGSSRPSAQPPSEPGANERIPGTYQRRFGSGSERSDVPREAPAQPRQPQQIERTFPNEGARERQPFPGRGSAAERPQRFEPQREVGPRPEMQSAPREPGQDNRGRRSRGGA